MKLIPPNGCEIRSFDVTLMHFLENIRKNLAGRDCGQYKVLGTKELALWLKSASAHDSTTYRTSQFDPRLETKPLFDYHVVVIERLEDWRGGWRFSLGSLDILLLLFFLMEWIFLFNRGKIFGFSNLSYFLFEIVLWLEGYFKMLFSKQWVIFYKDFSYLPLIFTKQSSSRVTVVPKYITDVGRDFWVDLVLFLLVLLG